MTLNRGSRFQVWVVVPVTGLVAGAGLAVLAAQGLDQARGGGAGPEPQVAAPASRASSGDQPAGDLRVRPAPRPPSTLLRPLASVTAVEPAEPISVMAQTVLSSPVWSSTTIVAVAPPPPPPPPVVVAAPPPLVAPAAQPPAPSPPLDPDAAVPEEPDVVPPAEEPEPVEEPPYEAPAPVEEPAPAPEDPLVPADPPVTEEPAPTTEQATTGSAESTAVDPVV